MYGIGFFKESVEQVKSVYPFVIIADAIIGMTMMYEDATITIWYIVGLTIVSLFILTTLIAISLAYHRNNHDGN